MSTTLHSHPPHLERAHPAPARRVRLHHRVALRLGLALIAYGRGVRPGRDELAERYRTAREAAQAHAATERLVLLTRPF